MRMNILSRIVFLWKNVELARFFLIGALNTMVGYIIFLLAVLAGLHYSISIAIATVLGTFFNFKSTGALVFRSKSNKKLLKFLMVYALVYVLNVIGVSIFVKFEIKEWLAGLLLLFPVAMFSYFLNRKYVFA